MRQSRDAKGGACSIEIWLGRGLLRVITLEHSGDLSAVFGVVRGEEADHTVLEPIEFAHFVCGDGILRDLLGALLQGSEVPHLLGLGSGLGSELGLGLGSGSGSGLGSGSG